MLRLFGRDIYYGWFIALSLAITETVSYGIMYYAFSVFLTPMEAELGWSRGQLTGGFSLALLVAGLIAFPIGWWVDKYGARLLMTVGSIGATVLVLAWSRMTTIPEFYLIWLGMGVCAAMVFYDPAFAVIATWFSRKRSAALTIVTLVAGFASTIFLPLSDYLLQLYGWRDAVFILGVILGVITIPLNWFILRRHPNDMGLYPDGEKITFNDDEKPKVKPSLSLKFAIQSRFFWLLTLAFVVAGFGTAAIRVHFIPYLIDIGIASSTAAFASGMIGTMQVAGRLVFTPLDNRISGRMLLAGLFALQAFGVAILFLGASFWLIFIFVAMFGASIGMRTLVRPSILADTYGSANYGRISSVMALPLTLSATAAPVVAGVLFDYSGNYTLVLWIAIVLSVLAFAIMLVTKAPDVADIDLESTHPKI